MDPIPRARTAIRRISRLLEQLHTAREQRDAAIANALEQGMRPPDVARQLEPDVSLAHVNDVKRRERLRREAGGPN